jgi:REP element-mobilizing transposase RayT
MEYQEEHHSSHLVVYHVMGLGCPKRRRPARVGPTCARLEQRIRPVAAAHQWTVIAVSMQPNPVHLVHPGPSRPGAPADLPLGSQGRRAHDVREEWPPVQEWPVR